MSTVATILGLEKAGADLCRFKWTKRGREQEIRKLTITPDLNVWLDAAGKGLGAVGEMKAKARSNFRQFASGQPIDDRYFMKRTEDRRTPSHLFSHGVWAMSVRFHPQYRFFGFFAIRDWFVILSKAGRDDLEKSDHLWHAEIDNCRKAWAAHLPGRDPWIRDHLSEYLSNAEKLDDRW